MCLLKEFDTHVEVVVNLHAERWLRLEALSVTDQKDGKNVQQNYPTASLSLAPVNLSGAFSQVCSSKISAT